MRKLSYSNSNTLSTVDLTSLKLSHQKLPEKKTFPLRIITISIFCSSRKTQKFSISSSRLLAFSFHKSSPSAQIRIFPLVSVLSSPCLRKLSESRARKCRKSGRIKKLFCKQSTDNSVSGAFILVEKFLLWSHPLGWSNVTNWITFSEWPLTRISFTISQESEIVIAGKCEATATGCVVSYFDVCSRKINR